MLCAIENNVTLHQYINKMTKYYLCMRKVLLLFISLISCLYINAGDGTQVTPSDLGYYDKEITQNSNGDTYILFTCASNDGVCYRMQILDKDGKRLLGRGGKVISAEKNRAWTSYNQYLQTDQEGNAFVAVQDMRNNKDAVLDSLFYTVYKYSPTGELLWQGTTLNDGVGSPLSSGMIMMNTEDDGLLCVYRFCDKEMVNDYAHLEKLDKDGNCVWKKDVFKTSRDVNMHPYPFLLKSGEKEAMLLWANADGNILANIVNTETGDIKLDSPQTVYTGGYASSKIMEVIEVQPGPDNGALITVIDGDMQGRVLYINSDLTIGLDGQTTGVLLDYSGNVSYVSNRPTVTYCPNDNTFACLYKSFNYEDKRIQGVYYQKLDMEGKALWDNGGKAFVPVQNSYQYGYFKIRNLGDDCTALFYLKYDNTSYSVNGEYTVFDNEGNASEPVEFASEGNSKVELWVSDKLEGDKFVTAWDQKNSTLYTLFTENVSVTHTSDISKVASDYVSSDDESIYSIDGVKLGKMQKGINIIRQHDGKTIKVAK